MRHQPIQLLSPAPGTQRSLSCFRFGKEQTSAPRVYLQAGLHADEWPGLLVLQHLMADLKVLEQEGALRGEVVVVPYANPVGLAQNVFGYVTGRFDLVGTGNFNRNFPVLPDQVARRVSDSLTDEPAHNETIIRRAIQGTIEDWVTQDESAALKKQLLRLSCDADVVLDLHCDDRTTAHIYAASAQREQALLLAESTGIQTLLLDDLVGPVAFDGTHVQVWSELRERFPAYPIPLPVFSATVEYRGQIEVDDGLAQEDATRLLLYMQRLGVLSTEQRLPELLPHQDIRLVPLERVEAITAPAAGLVVFHRRLQDSVQADDLFAEIVLLDSGSPNERLPIRIRSEGYVMGLSHRRLVRPGDLIGKIAGYREN